MAIDAKSGLKFEKCPLVAELKLNKATFKILKDGYKVKKKNVPGGQVFFQGFSIVPSKY